MSSEPISGVPSRWLSILVAAAALLAAALILVATRLGAGATPDTGHYLATADNVLAGRGFVRMGPEIMASWPPLFPAVDCDPGGVRAYVPGVAPFVSRGSPCRRRVWRRGGRAADRPNG